jgi:hypothetical protein
MRPDDEQKQWLLQRLRKVLKYHETYEEVYDHVLLAQESRPKEKSFEDAAELIITDDFGGNKGLFTMEKSCRDAVVTGVWKQYWRYFFSYFKFPYVLYLACIAVIAGYIAVHTSFGVIILSCSIGIICAIMVPVLLFAGRKFKLGYKLNGPQKLLKDSILAALAFRPCKFFWWCIFLAILQHDTQNMINYNAVFDLWKQIAPAILIVIFIAATIHCISFIRIIKGEFKISMIR